MMAFFKKLFVFIKIRRYKSNGVRAERYLFCVYIFDVVNRLDMKILSAIQPISSIVIFSVMLSLNVLIYGFALLPYDITVRFGLLKIYMSNGAP